MTTIRTYTAAAIMAIDPTAEVVTDVANRKVQVTTAVDTEAVKDAVKNAGYLPA